MSEYPEPETLTNKQLTVSRLHAAVARLPLALRQVTMLAMEDMSPKEIADVMGVSANAVSIKLTRAKKALRVILEDLA